MQLTTLWRMAALKRIMRCSTLRVAATALVVTLISCTSPAHEQDGISRIKHVVLVIQENRSFDNLFHAFPGADSAENGVTHTGRRVALHPVSLKAPYDINHSFADFKKAFDNGKMDGFDLAHAGGRRGTHVVFDTAFPQYAFVPQREVAEYWQMARQWALADHMFQSNYDQSFAAHLYLIAGYAGRAVNVPSGRPWGCDAGQGAAVATLNERQTLGHKVFPCFSFKTIGDELDAKRINWRYYAPALNDRQAWQRAAASIRSGHRVQKHLEFGQVWSAFDAIDHVRFGPDWALRVRSPETALIADIKTGHLPAMTWVVPSLAHSDHSISGSDSGPSWVAAIVNEIGHSSYWRDTVVLVVWDDSGGWYDHVPPPQVDYDGLGCRVPLLVISAYAKQGYIEHTQLEFGSILKFVEAVFHLPALAASDARAASINTMFDFKQGARKYQTIETRRSARTVVRDEPSESMPDDE